MKSIFGSAQYFEITSNQSIEDALEDTLKLIPSGILILCCDQSYVEPAYFDSLLKSAPCTVVGGVFPEVIVGSQTYEKGLVLVPIFSSVEVEVIRDLTQIPSRPLTFGMKVQDYSSLLVLVDGLSRNVDHALNQIFAHCGQQLKVFGGGAGSLSFAEKPYLFSNEGVLADAMLVIAIQQPVNLAIAHGWDVLAGPFLANQTDDHTIIQLNFEPALKVYQEIVEQHDGRLFSEHEFIELAKTYPFGIDRLDDEVLVRDPLTFEQDSLVCVGKIPENTMLYILSGKSDNLLEAVATATKQKLTNTTQRQGIVFDCIGRKIFLEDKFNTELTSICQALGDNSAVFGALVLGEIASGQSGSISFHNKTAVVAIT